MRLLVLILAFVLSLPSLVPAAAPPSGSALCIAVTPDGKRALSGGTDGTLRLWPLPH